MAAADFIIGTDVLNATRDATTKAVLFQTGDVAHEQTESDNVESWQHAGFVSIPSAPTKGQSACQAVVLRRPSNEVCIATRDLRGLTLAGSLADGETCVYAAGTDGEAQARALFKADGSVTLYTTDDNTATGQSVALQVSPTEVSAGTPWGAFKLSADGFTIAVNGGAALKLGSDGTITLIGTTIALNGGAVSVGANATNPVLWGASGPAGVASTSVKVAL